MNMISTGAFLTEMDASNKQTTVAEKFAAVWEKKNAKAARAGGVSLMALSLAACGGSSSTTTTTTPAADPEPTTPVAPAAQSLSLTVGIDSITGGAGDDTIDGNPQSNANGGAVQTNDVLTAMDTIDGGAGNDTLNITQVGAFTVPAGVTVKNVETANIKSNAAVTLDSSEWTGLTAVNATGKVSADIDAATTTDVDLTVTGNTSTTAVTADGGNNVTVTASVTGLANAAAGGAVTVGGTTKAAGNVVVTDSVTSAAVGNTHNATGGAITVTGGDTVTVTSSIAPTAAAATTVKTGSVSVTATHGAITVNGDAQTTAVTVKQAAEVTAVSSATKGVVGIVNGQVDIVDKNAATASDTITTATIENFGTTTVTSSVLSTLNVVGGTASTTESGAITLDKSAADESTVSTTLKIAGTGFIGAIDGTLADAITTLNIEAGADGLTIADLNSVDAVTAVTASGAGVTTITAHAGDAAVTSYTSTGGGLKIAAAIGNGVSFTGSSGTDSVIVGATTKAIAMGAGDDSATVTAVLGTGGTVDGGAGSDTLVINVAAATFSDAAAQPRITGFEKLELGTAATGSYNGAGFTEGYSLTGALTGNSTITNAVANSTVTIGTTTGKTLDVVYADATGKADVANLVLSSKAALDLDTNADVTFAGVETINITSTDKDTTAHQNTLDLDVVDATTITATGSAGLVMVNAGNVKVTSFDASGISVAKVTDNGVTFTSANVTVGENVTIKGSNGKDTLTGNVNTNDTIEGGSGVDTIVYTGGTDTFTGGAGKDKFDVDHFGTKTSYLTISDIADGDTIDLVGLSTSGTIADVSAANWKAAQVKLGASATFDQYLAAATDGNGSANELVEWFVFGGDTYIAVTSDNVAGFNAGDDSIIKLAGVHNIEDSSITTEVLTIA